MAIYFIAKFLDDLFHVRILTLAFGEDDCSFQKTMLVPAVTATGLPGFSTLVTEFGSTEAPTKQLAKDS